MLRRARRRPFAPVQARPKRRGGGACRSGGRLRGRRFGRANSNSATRLSVPNRPRCTTRRAEARRASPGAGRKRRRGSRGEPAHRNQSGARRHRAASPRGRRRRGLPSARSGTSRCAASLEPRLRRAEPVSARTSSPPHIPLARERTAACDERHPLQPEPQRLAVDQRGHLQRHQRVAQQERRRGSVVSSLRRP